MAKGLCCGLARDLLAGSSPGRTGERLHLPPGKPVQIPGCRAQGAATASCEPLAKRGDVEQAVKVGNEQLWVCQAHRGRNQTMQGQPSDPPCLASTLLSSPCPHIRVFSCWERPWSGISPELGWSGVQGSPVRPQSHCQACG